MDDDHVRDLDRPPAHRVKSTTQPVHGDWLFAIACTRRAFGWLDPQAPANDLKVLEFMPTNAQVKWAGPRGLVPVCDRPVFVSGWWHHGCHHGWWSGASWGVLVSASNRIAIR